MKFVFLFKGNVDAPNYKHLHEIGIAQAPVNELFNDYFSSIDLELTVEVQREKLFDLERHSSK